MVDVLKFIFFGILISAAMVYMKHVPTVLIIGATLFGGYLGYKLAKDEKKDHISLVKSAAFAAVIFFVSSFLLLV